MAEKKNTHFDRPGGYAQPRGSTQTHRKMAKPLTEAQIKLYGDGVPPHDARAMPRAGCPKPAFASSNPETQLYIGDCRDILPILPERGHVDLIFADPPFNWEVPYGGDAAGGGWNDAMPRAEYERFTFDWLDGCIEVLAPHGSIFVNVPDDIAAEVVLHLKRRGLAMINWCIWHFRFGQNRNSSFIMSKVHVLYFAKLGRAPDGNPVLRSADGAALSCGALNADRIWNPDAILELSDRASIYADPRTMNKESNKGLRVPMDVWYGKYWGRIQGNNKERRHNHHNQIPEIYLERVIKACSNCCVTGLPGEGSLVLDPFCGSGTTSTVARALGRRSITIEYSPVNAASAWERITKVGMIPREDAGKPQSTAIFGSRRKRTKAPA
jgi:adenine-specific DNA-methyltransferase